jgi:hypothetical protein
MSECKVIKPFLGVPDGEIYPVEFNIDDMVSGDLAKVAVNEGWAVPVSPPAKPPKGNQPVDPVQ